MKLLSTILFTTTLLFASEAKEIKKSIPIHNSKTIELHGFTGSEIEIQSWDKNEVSIDIKVEYSSSDKEREQEYFQRVDIIHDETSDRLKISYKEPKMENGFSWKNFFKSIFSSYSNLEVKGVIFVPASSPLVSDMRYGFYSFTGIKGRLELNGTGNTLKLKNCESLQKVENNYGTTTIENSGGNLDLESMSSTITISDFNGTLDARADYSTVTVTNIKKDTKIQCSSGRLNIDNINGNVTLDANYSTIHALNIKGKLTVASTSGTIVANQVGGVYIDAPYSNIKMETVNGTGDPIIIKNSSGKIDITTAMRDIRIDDSYSVIQLANIQGNVAINGTGSTLQGKKITGNLLVKTEYGNVDVEELSASTVEVENKSNRIDLQLLTKPTKVQIANDYGPVDISLPDYSGDVKLKASYGKITTNMSVEIEEMGEGAIAIGKVGNGNGTMNIRTVSGNIVVRQNK
ncbi:MAG: DUF4097 family beta strand repeat protein [Ignavibacteriales bacterium]|nr:DUF4097 family beta strand repeat protein [Ignavibacteriales bacterium]